MFLPTPCGGLPCPLLAVELQKGIVDPSGSPLGILKIAGFKGSSTDNMVTDVLNGSIFSRLGAQIPGGYVDYFNFSGSGIIADRGIGVLLLGTVFILAVGVARVWIPALFLICYTAFVRILEPPSRRNLGIRRYAVWTSHGRNSGGGLFNGR